MLSLARRLRSLPVAGRIPLVVGAALVLVAGVTLGFLTLRPGSIPLQRPAVPRVIALVTDSGAAVADGDLVPSGTRLSLTFNTAMNAGSIAVTANGASLRLTWAPGGESAAIDAGSLGIGPVALAIAPGGRGATGGVLSPWSLGFRVVFASRARTVRLVAPVLVQVPNDAAARDQTGLQSAAIVYEYLTEGGITRFTAVFSSAPDAIGPIRSGRLISFALTRRYHGLLMASGLSDGSAAVLRADPVPYVFDTGNGVFHRTSGRPAPDNLFTAAGDVQRALAGASLASFALPAPAVPIKSGVDGQAMTVAEHRSRYTFDPVTRTYTKQVDGRTLTDAATGEPLRVELVVLMHTTATRTSFVEDVNGQPGLDFDMQSGGRAEFLFDGLMVSGRWSSPGGDVPPRFELPSGAVVVPPPLTWVDVVTS